MYIHTGEREREQCLRLVWWVVRSRWRWVHRTNPDMQDVYIKRPLSLANFVSISMSRTPSLLRTLDTYKWIWAHEIRCCVNKYVTNSLSLTNSLYILKCADRNEHMRHTSTSKPPHLLDYVTNALFLTHSLCIHAGGNGHFETAILGPVFKCGGPPLSYCSQRSTACPPRHSVTGADVAVCCSVLQRSAACPA